MPLSISTNIASMTAQRSFLNSNADLETAFERLSTGKRINSSTDDAAGLAIGKGLESRVSGLNQAIRNVNDGISMVQIAEGTLDEVTTILQRMRDLAVQGANDSLGTTERGYLDTEHSKLAEALGKALDQAKFNDTDLIGDSSSTTAVLQSGSDAGDTTSIEISALSEASLNVAASNIDMTGATNAQFEVTAPLGSAAGSGKYTVTVNGVTYESDAADVTATSAGDLITEFNTSDFTSTDGNSTRLDSVFDIEQGATSADIKFTAKTTGDFGATLVIDMSGGSNATFSAGTTSVTKAGGTGISVIDAALSTVATQRATLGATQAQLESTVRNLANVAENTSAAAGRIMDTDYAAETANLTKAQILQQAATSVLAQANAQPEGILSLLQ
ncbi:flagellin [Luminiphilus sp.]|nr:flagellin [Luminiphilus sp.]